MIVKHTECSDNGNAAMNTVNWRQPWSNIPRFPVKVTYHEEAVGALHKPLELMLTLLQLCRRMKEINVV